MLSAVATARTNRADLIVFPEMAIPGYLLGDEWEHEAFLRECEACAEEIRCAAEGIVIVFGSIGLDWTRRNEDGRVRKYNAAFVAENRKFLPPAHNLLPFVVKTLLPNYREFDDSRHFFDLRKLALEEGRPAEDLIAPVRTSRFTLACILCEDAWDSDYGLSPLEALTRYEVDMYVNLSSSPFTLNKNHKRHRVFSAQAKRLKRPLVYINNVGIQNNGKTVFTFDGSSCVYDGNGNTVHCDPPFKETMQTIDVALGPDDSFGDPLILKVDDIGDAHRAIKYGTRRFLETCGAERVVVGVSGGIDSAVVAALYSQILDPRDLLLVNMPGPFTSATTRGLAEQLAKNLDVGYIEIPISAGVDTTRSQLHQLHVKNPSRTVEYRLQLSSAAMENVQARDRSSRILAAVAAAFGGVFTCNANKSEATVGYTTLYGDLAGYFANIADLWKTEVYALARHLNAEVFEREIIPTGCLDIPPSAELSPTQDVDKGQGDPLIYEYHDRLFESWVEWWNRATPEDILGWYARGELEEKLGYKGQIVDRFPDAPAFIADLERWWSLYQGIGVAKRIQAPPVLAVKRRAFGFDHREAQMGARYTRCYEELKRKLLA
jgi:NAD+ synthase (glutamine-hydrolysing)